MPSSLIFAGLVVLWLLILVPAVARRQQEVVRPSEAALSGRVLERSVRHRSQEVYGMDTDDERDEPLSGPVATRQAAGAPKAREGDDLAEALGADDRADDPAGDRADEVGDLAGDGPPESRDGEFDTRPDREYDDETARGPEGEIDDGIEDYDGVEGPEGSDPDERHWERPPAAFRPGRGGFDAEAAALAARARYAFRQRVVVGLLVLAVLTAGVAVFATSAIWWIHGLVDVALIGYLGYLRRQVRMEETIRARRAARMAGTRRASAADDPELDEWARRGSAVDEDDAAGAGGYDEPRGSGEHDGTEDWTADDGAPERVRGTGEPIGVLPAHRRTVGDVPGEESFEPALPRLQPGPPPSLPAGTQVVDVDEDEDEESSVVGRPTAPYRRAAGE